MTCRSVMARPMKGLTQLSEARLGSVAQIAWRSNCSGGLFVLSLALLVWQRRRLPLKIRTYEWSAEKMSVMRGQDEEERRRGRVGALFHCGPEAALQRILATSVGARAVGLSSSSSP